MKNPLDTILQPWAKTLAAKPRQLFLLDGLGAGLSLFMLGVVLPRFEAFFGMPAIVLYKLALTAGLFALYDFYHARWTPERWQARLGVMVVANILYGLLSLYLMFVHAQQLSILGILYFTLELAVLALVVRIEILALRQRQV